MEPLEIAQFTAMILALLASAVLDRKIFILMNFALLMFCGIIWMLFPKMLLEMHAVGTPTHWHLLVSQFLGLVVFATGLAFLMFRNTSDERASKALLSLLAQCFASEIVVIGLGHMQLKGGKPGKGEVVFKALLGGPEMWLLYSILFLWLVVIIIHYLRSPSVKPSVPAHYDRQLNVHQSTLYYLMFVSSLISILAPESCLGMYIKNADIPFDSTMKLNIQLCGAFSLAHSSFISNSMDFTSKEDQGKVFQANMLLMVIQALFVGTHIFLHTFTFMDILPMMVAMVLCMLNSILGLRRSSIVDFDSKDLKKRR